MIRAYKTPASPDAGLLHPSPRPTPQEGADAIVVLGALVHPDGRLSTTLRNRLETALAEDARRPAKVLILCGGKVGGAPAPEAVCMSAYLAGRGVEPERLVEERQSRSTWENLAFVRPILESLSIREIRLVTSDYHMRRATLLARRLEICCTPCPAPGPLKRRSRLRARLREGMSWVRLLIRRTH